MYYLLMVENIGNIFGVTVEEDKPEGKGMISGSRMV